MKGISANLSMLFTELPFLERFDAAASAGFRAVEFWFPYEHSPEDTLHALRSANLGCVVMNTPAGDIAAGDWGLAIDPENQPTFKQSLDQALDYASIIGSENLHVMAGVMPAPEGPDKAMVIKAACEQTYVENLKYACDKAQHMHLRLLIEPLNSVDRPRYFLSKLDQAINLINAIDSPKLAVMWDVYHAQIEQGNLADKIRAHSHHFGHVQIADVPGRNEPGTGEINWPFLLRELRHSRYGGWVGFEYKPTRATQDSLTYSLASANLS